VRNQRIAANIKAALARHEAQRSGEVVAENALQRLDKVQSIVDRRVAGERERNWKIREIADRENIDYMTVHRALKGRPGWSAYGRTIRVTDTLYRAWLTSIGLGIPLDEYLNMPQTG
jgi:hypothetical protein